jgi:hypothetical protein
MRSIVYAYCTYICAYMINRTYNLQVRVYIAVPRTLRAKQLTVSLHRTRIAVCAKLPLPQTQSDSPSTTAGDAPALVDTPLLTGRLARPILSSESLWMLDTPGLLCLHLQKELPSQGENGFEWWDRVLCGDAPIDLAAVHAGEDVRAYPEHARLKAARALWDQQQQQQQAAGAQQQGQWIAVV